MYIKPALAGRPVIRVTASLYESASVTWSGSPGWFSISFQPIDATFSVSIGWFYADAVGVAYCILRARRQLPTMEAPRS